MAGNPSILVVGSINMDLVVRAPRLPMPGETVLGGTFSTGPGGKGANQAVAAARLGGRCRMIGRVGDDAFGAALIENLQAVGVLADAVLVTPHQPSGVAMIVVDAVGENAIVVAGGANHCVSPRDLADHEDLFAQAEVVVLQLELPYPTVSAAAVLARRHGCRVVLDTAPARADLPASLFQVDVLTPNRTEAEILTSQPAADLPAAQAVAAELLNRGPGAVVLKLGSAGSLVATKTGPACHIRPYKVGVADTTGAGDAFTAGLAVALAEGQPLDQAAALGNAAGALAATRHGAQAAMPTRQEVAMLMEQQRS